MEQFEELMRAAEQVSPAARPLPLFYALSQAGRAVAAAHAGEPWQLRGHGLQLKDQGKPLLERRVSPNGRADASFRRVAETSGSDILEQPVTIGALCASLPDLALVPELCGENPRALFVRPIAQSSGAMLVMGAEVQAQVFNLPSDANLASDPCSVLDKHLRHYPTAQGWALPENVRLFPPEGGGGPGIVLQWRVSGVQSPNEPDRQKRMSEVAPLYRYSGHQWCRPMVATKTLLSPLMTWWALLYALSMVARYEPDDWLDSLNINENRLAVPLEGLLDDALDAVPHLLLDALDSTPFILRSVSQ